MTTTRKPSLIAWTVSGTGKQAHWTRIGCAWLQNHNDGFNLALQALPVNGRIVLLPPKDDEAASDGEGAP